MARIIVADTEYDGLALHRPQHRNKCPGSEDIAAPIEIGPIVH